MTREEWRKNIKKSCEEVGTYKEAFDAIINTLADILETRDATFEAYDGIPIVEHTNSHGETNTAKNPALMLWNDLNAQALSYWKELGLTAAGLKRINESSMRSEEKESALEKALREIGEERSNKKLETSFAVRREHPKRGKNRVPRVKTGG